jgi:hypothetical protein
MKIQTLSLKEIRKKKLFTLLMLLVCVIAMQTILSAVTNAASCFYQKKIFESGIGVDMGEVLHLNYRQTEENPEFAQTIRQYLDYIRKIPGVKTVGQFDAAGMYFSELETNEEYQALNGKLLAGKKYENHPAITQLLSVDEEMLTFVKNGITEYADAPSGFLPLYASEVFQDILPPGTVLTDQRTGDKYEITGYIPKDAQWVEEDDLIRFPMFSLRGWFIAPFTEQSRSDIMTQLSMLHNTYVLLSDHADIADIQTQISEYSIRHGFEASAVLLSEEYETYRLETKTYTNRQIILAIFISVMAVSSIAAVFTTNTLLKKKRYGVLIANGFTRSDIAAEISAEIFMILFTSGALSWVLKWIEFKRSADLFQGVLLTAHLRYTLPLCSALAVILTGISAWIPITQVFRYQPSELIGGNDNGID